MLALAWHVWYNYAAHSLWLATVILLVIMLLTTLLRYCLPQSFFFSAASRIPAQKLGRRLNSTLNKRQEAYLLSTWPRHQKLLQPSKVL
jgi:hypothetical protein